MDNYRGYVHLVQTLLARTTELGGSVGPSSSLKSPSKNPPTRARSPSNNGRWRRLGVVGRAM